MKYSFHEIPQGYVEKQALANEITMNYVEGPSNGFPLLLIPGQMESWQGYLPVMAELAVKQHVFIVDVRGQGKSSRTPGRYSYNICGEDLRLFIRTVVQQPCIVSGLSSGGVLAIWLAAYAGDSVRAVIAEDPPIYSSIWPRIAEEKFMAYGFQNLVDHIHGENRDIRGYFQNMGYVKPGDDRLYKIPRGLANLIVNLAEWQKKRKPLRPYDVPFLPFYMRGLFKYFQEYDVDFSRATLDGRLSAGFDPDDALAKIRCPMLLMQANWSRHATWGLLGAMDDRDVARVRSLVKALHYERADAMHDIHAEKPTWWLEKFTRFVGDLNLEAPLR
jgi:pimeloyl-ACP methyl ester carboxylesterase